MLFESMFSTYTRIFFHFLLKEEEKCWHLIGIVCKKEVVLVEKECIIGERQ